MIKTLFKASTALVVISITFLTACSKPPTTISATSHDQALDYLTDKWITKVTPMGLPNEQWAHDEVRKNIARDINCWRKIANDPRRVFVSTTFDTKTYTITIVSADGSASTLWLDKDGNVESITRF